MCLQQGPVCAFSMSSPLMLPTASALHWLSTPTLLSLLLTSPRAPHRPVIYYMSRPKPVMTGLLAVMLHGGTFYMDTVCSNVLAQGLHMCVDDY